MTAELGQIALLSALLMALSLGLLPMIGAYTGNRRMMAIASNAALLHSLLVVIAFAILNPSLSSSIAFSGSATAKWR